MCDRHHREDGHCCPGPRRVRGFMQPWLLLLLAQKPAHGYELIERLTQEEAIPGADPGLLYRTLRQFEEEGLVRSSWDTEGRGPARRVYELTAEGLEYLHGWAATIRRTRERLGRFLAEYEARFPSQAERR
ncbi:MAG: helix-turn-helix transcriptional regulator [Chloroflexia bacterium]